LRRIFSETDAPSVKVRETADRDTLARSATSFSVTAIALTSSCCGPTSRRASAFLIFSDSEIRLFIADLQ
jgi:hypothetical protein